MEGARIVAGDRHPICVRDFDHIVLVELLEGASVTPLALGAVLAEIVGVCGEVDLVVVLGGGEGGLDLGP